MRASAIAVLLLLVTSVSLAGCFAEEEAPVAPVAEEPAAPAVAVDDGTMPMDMDAGHMPHLHDYWDNRERVTIMDLDVTVDPQMGMFFTFRNAFTGEPAAGGAYLEPPEGSIVYEGTGKLEFTSTWSDATVTGMKLAYASAASSSFTDAGALASGTPVVIDVTPEMTDMPHAQTSRWGFFITPATGQSMVGTFHVKVDIVKIRDITQFPGHPELFGDADTLTLFDGPAESSQSNFAMDIVKFASGGSQEQGIASAKVVPMETMSMTANLTITSANSNVGTISDIWFMYKSADSRRYVRAHQVSGDVATGIFQFAWPVEMGQVDSPYAKESQWRFDVRVGTQSTGIGGPCDRCADAQVSYDVEIVAYDTLLPDAVKDENQGRG